MTQPHDITYAFFGSSRFSAIVLDELEKAGYPPSVIVTVPDKPRGRKLAIAPTPVKEWALKKNAGGANAIRIYDPAKLDAAFVERLEAEKCALFVVASYGKILPEAVIDIPPHKTLNIHPSLLPRYRGAAPLQSAMLDNAKQTGVTIMQIDRQMDHGPIVAQKGVAIEKWPPYEEFEETMAREGARLLAGIIPGWIAGAIAPHEQDHTAATFTKKVAKEDGLIDLSADPYENFRKIQAYHGWPQAYFFVEHAGKKMRVKIRAASFDEGAETLAIEKVVPEGGTEMGYDDFLRGYVR